MILESQGREYPKKEEEEEEKQSRWWFPPRDEAAGERWSKRKNEKAGAVMTITTILDISRKMREKDRNLYLKECTCPFNV